MFLPWATTEGIIEPGQITSRVLDRYTAHLLEHGGKRGPLSRHSVASFVESVNWWLRWLQAEGELKAKAAAQVPRRPERVLDVLSREEIQQLEDAARSERDKLMIRLLADTGMRVGELLGLRCSDLVERDRNHYVRLAGRSGPAHGERRRDARTLRDPTLHALPRAVRGRPGVRRAPGRPGRGGTALLSGRD
jgi:integrase